MTAPRKRKVSYYYDSDVWSYYYGAGHPMKPFRLNLTHELLVTYGLYRKMDLYRPHVASKQEMLMFHDEEYVDFLKAINPDNYKAMSKSLQKFALGDKTDCPVFDGLFEFCQKTAGGSIDAAIKVNHKQADIAINWSGGLHHAKKLEASGFCYINDIVLCILELLKYYQRVVYIDIDIHHGDGVEEAFYTTNRVMTVSFHKHGDFFPGTGDFRDIGSGGGKNYSVNFPLKMGIDDESYQKIFRPVMQKVMEVYRPEVIVLQCGADSLTNDRLGDFNITLKGHGQCVEFMKSFDVPLILLGGGGYRVENVARCWAYETALAIDTEIDNNIPYNRFFQYYGPSFKLHLDKDPELINNNSPKHLSDMKTRLLQQLKHVEAVPSVEFQDRVPDARDLDEAAARERDNRDPDASTKETSTNLKSVPDNEFYDLS